MEMKTAKFNSRKFKEGYNSRGQDLLGSGNAEYSIINRYYQYIITSYMCSLLNSYILKHDIHFSTIWKNFSHG